MASRKHGPRPITPNFFPLGDDLPLFSATCPAPVERPFVAVPVARQESLIDLRLDPFHTIDNQADPARSS